MMRGKKFLLFFVVFVAIMTLSVAVAYAVTDEEINALETQIETINSDIESLETQIEEKEQEIGQADDENKSTLEAEKATLEQQKTDLETQRAALVNQKELLEAQKAVSDAQSVLDELLASEEATQEQIEAARQALEEAKQTLNELQPTPTPTPTPNPTDTVTPTPTPTPTTDTTETPATQEEIQEANNEAVENLSDGTQETSDAIDAAKEALENAGVTKQLSAEEAAALVQNQKEIAAEKTTEAVNNKVAETTVPAASDLLSDTPLSNLDNLSAAPKATEPGRPTAEEQNQIVNNLSASNLNNVDSESKADIPEDFDPSEIQEATEENLTIDALTDSLADQAEIIQDLFNAIKAYLTKVANTTHGVTLATGMPTLRPHSTGYFPMNMNMRNLVPGQRVRFWSSPQALEAATNENSSGQKAMKNSVSLAADNDKEGSAFFLDSNGNPTTVVSGDASKMKVVPYLVAGEVYDSAFITVDATEEDQKAIEALAAQETTTAKNSSSSSSGGCDTGFGAAALLAAAFLLKKKR